MRIVVVVVVALLAAVGCSDNAPAASSSDLGASGDMAELRSSDMASPADALPPPPLPDMAELPAVVDMTPSPPDLTPSCGAAEGQMCCAVPQMLPECQHRDVNTGQIIGCDQDAGVCVRCGGLDLPCCPGDVCYGGTKCGKNGKPGICT